MAIISFLLLATAAFAFEEISERGLSTVCAPNGGSCYLLQLQHYEGCGINDGLPTIHGLWPQWSQYCSTEPFDASNLASIRADMDAYWPTCLGQKTPAATEGFWNHEWTRHGVCSGMSQLDYFSTALGLAKQYRSQCSGGNCGFCFNRDLTATEQCAASSSANQAAMMAMASPVSTATVASAVAQSPSLLRGSMAALTSCAEGGDCYLLRLQNFANCGANGFTLHGLWPEWQENCGGAAFDVNQIASIRSDMELYWPTCEGSDSVEEFWAHEWESHGSCSGMSQLDFFSTALSLGEQYRNGCTNSSSECSVCFDSSLSSIQSCVGGYSSAMNVATQ